MLNAKIARFFAKNRLGDSFPDLPCSIRILEPEVAETLLRGKLFSSGQDPMQELRLELCMSRGDRRALDRELACGAGTWVFLIRLQRALAPVLS